jgi:hypothetical protein
MGVIFGEGDDHHLQFCVDHLSCIKMAAFLLYLQLGKQRKIGWVGEYSHAVFDQKFMVKKEVCDSAFS